jgi:RHS repeat-associated protein
MRTIVNRKSRTRAIVMVAAAALVGGLLTDAQAWAQMSPPDVQLPSPVELRDVPVKAAPTGDTDTVVEPTTVEVPAPGDRTLELDRGATASIDGAPLRIGLLRPAVTQRRNQSPTTSAVVEVADAKVTEQLGAALVAKIEAPQASVEGVAVQIDVDYTALPGLASGDAASRARWVELPACAMTAPATPACQTRTPIQTSNDVQGRTASTELTIAPTATVIALAAAAGGPSGDYSATDLAASSAWSGGSNSGDFNWSYPFRVPPAVGGPAPSLALQYSSGSVDGRVASTNSQPSWIGEGHSLNAGFIERRYIPCADDQSGGNNTVKTGDLCWKTDNATISFGSRSGEIIKDSTTGKWRLENDDASRIERFTTGTNNDNDKEYWVLTTGDGTQYFFGVGKRYSTDTVATNSTWTVPVFGNQTGEPCRQTTFATSWCNQAWRWNLDYVKDPRGNTATYFYTTETNRYGRNNNTASASYDRGGYLTRIEYGERAGTEHSTAATAQVLFTVAERCIPTSSPAFTCDPSLLTSANASKWPDVPFDQICTSTTSCANRLSPTFFSRKRLTTIKTQYRSGTSTFSDVDTWALNHSFPSPGDGTSAALWLTSITHTGNVGTAVTLPSVTFSGVQLANRVDAVGDSAPPMIKYRVAVITTESGASYTVNYKPAECTPSNKPSDPGNNDMRCFPVYWAAEGATEPTLNYFHKYVVDAIGEADLTGGAPARFTNYTFLGGGAWRYNDDPLTREKYRTWGDWRGFGRVRTIVGVPGDQTRNESTYLRGMNGDELPGGGTRSVSVSDSWGGTITDANRWSGFVRESFAIDADTGAEESATINDPWQSPPTATNGSKTARLMGTERVRTRTPLSGGGTRTTEQNTTFDTYGMPTTVEDLGDVSSSTDNTCTRTTYVRNTTAWILDPVSAVETVGVSCGATPNRPNDIEKSTRTYFDGATSLTATPTRGEPTKVETLKSWSGGTGVFAQTSRTVYDAYGRIIETYDAVDRKTATAYTPTTLGPVTGSTITNAKGHVGTFVIHPAWGSTTKETDANSKVIERTFDGLGRVTQVWGTDRAKATQTPTEKYTYTVSRTAANTVTTEELRNDGTYTKTVEIYDGLLRPRQKQATAAGGGRVISETLYGARGEVTAKFDQMYDTSTPSTTLVTSANPAQVPAQTQFEYDGIGRVVTERLLAANILKHATTTEYDGQRTHITPPTGGTATTSITDGRGRVTVLRQYEGPTPTGTYDQVTYSYRPGGALTGLTDAEGNEWSYNYDVRGRQVSATDPDRGTTTSTYNDLDQLVSTTDARGQTLAYTYDELGRRLTTRSGSVTGTVLASWTYDTLQKGRLTSASRFDGGNEYKTSTTGYDAGYRPTGVSTVIPASEGALAGTYSQAMTYNVDGGLKTMSLPAAPGLPSETLSYFYTAQGDLERMAGVGAYVAGTIRSPYGEALRLDTGSLVGKAVWQLFEYDEGTRRLTRAQLQRQGFTGSAIDLNYTYDQVGNVLKAADQPTAAGATPDTQCFDYDHLRRMEQAWTPASGDCGAAPTAAGLGGPAPYWQSWTFSDSGNRLSQTDHTAGGNTVRTSTFNAAGSPLPHALQQVDTTGPGATSPENYDYDAVGNLTASTVAGVNSTYTWDAEGRLGSVTKGSATSSFIYDADGNRLLRKEPGATTLYVGGTEIRLDTATLTKASTRYYTFDGHTLAQRTAAGVDLLFADRVKTAQMAVGNSTQAITQRRFTPHGKERGNPTGNWIGDKGFIGAPTDTSTGLVHIGARQYDRANGRFISVDPLLVTKDPQQLNGYAYSNNSPVTFSDPTGTCIPAEDGTGRCFYPGTNVSKPKPAGSGSRPTARSYPTGNGAAPATVSENKESSSTWYKDVVYGAGNGLWHGGPGFVGSVAGFFGWDSAEEKIEEAHLGLERWGGANVSSGFYKGGTATGLGVTMLGGTGLVSAGAKGGSKLVGRQASRGVGAARALPALPKALSGGADDTYVYIGARNGKPVYSGITNNLQRRSAQHGDRFDELQKVTSGPVTRGEARAIEQALIVRNPGFENKINSISPKHSYYGDAVKWGESWLRQNGM